MMETYDHLKGIKMNERDTKPELPIHVILGASDYKNFEQQLERNEGGWYETGLV